MSDGLIVSGIGIAITFVVLGVLGLAIYILGRFDREPAPTAVRPSAPVARPPAVAVRPPPTPRTAGDIPGDILAAIGAALAMAEAEMRGQAVAAGPAMQAARPQRAGDAWVHMGRTRQMISRTRSAVGRRSI